MRRNGRTLRALAGIGASLLVNMVSVAGAPAAAMQILEAVDHAELSAQISAGGVNRIALAGDRIARVIRGPGGYAVEHDPATGDLYLRPLEPHAAGMGATNTGADEAAGAEAREPVTLFVGTEKGFTYRLALTPAARDSAQILIRNAAASAVRDTSAAAGDPGDAYVVALVALVRAVAGREPLPGYAIEAAPAGIGVSGIGAGPAETHEPFRIVETWRGAGAFSRARYSAHVIEAHGAVGEASDLAGTIPGLVGRTAAVWLAAPGTGPGGGRLAVVVTEGVEPEGVEPGGVEPGGVEPGGVEPGGVEPGGVEPGGVGLGPADGAHPEDAR